MLNQKSLIRQLSTWKSDLVLFMNDKQNEECINDIINDIDITIEAMEDEEDPSNFELPKSVTEGFRQIRENSIIVENNGKIGSQTNIKTVTGNISF